MSVSIRGCFVLSLWILLFPGSGFADVAPPPPFPWPPFPPIDECAGKADGTPCAADANSCTRDVCHHGFCTHPPMVDGTPCEDDGKSCTQDYCLAVTCQHVAVPDGTICDEDDIVCTTGTCQAGECDQEEAPDWSPCPDDGLVCTSDVCIDGLCVHPDVQAGTVCDNGDGESCTFGRCVGDVCAGSEPVSDGTWCEADGVCCTSDVCRSGVCSHPPLLAGARCRSEQPECRGASMFCTPTGVGEDPACERKDVWAFVDTDGDGYDDDVDNCWAIFNTDQSDLDADGAGDACDCAPTVASIHPNVIESCNGVDDNCDGAIDEGYDADRDLVTVCGGDCDDNSRQVSPGLAEVCDDGLDNNCDGTVDELCAIAVPE